VEAEDPDNDRLTYSLQVSPAGWVIDPLSGLIEWPQVAGPTGPFPVQVKADDGRGGTDVQRFELTVQPDTAQTVVPELVGLIRPVAEVALLEAGLRAGAMHFEVHPLAQGTVIAQDPVAGGVILRGSTIGLTISLGPDL